MCLFSILVLRWAGCLFRDRRCALKLSVLEGGLAPHSLEDLSIICRLWPTLVPKEHWSSRQEAPLDRELSQFWRPGLIGKAHLGFQEEIFRKSIEAKHKIY